MTQRINHSPSTTAFLLLLMNGSLIALMLPLARMATDKGMSPLTYTFWQTLGAGCLLSVLSWRHLKFKLNRHIVRYCLVSGASGVAFPNAFAFFLVGEIGPGFTATLYAFPPIFTLAFALLLRMEAVNHRRLGGIALACLGCFCIVWAQQGISPPATLSWYLLGLAVPVSLAIGNIYRTIDWPDGVPSVALAAGMMLGASVWLVTIMAIKNINLLPQNIQVETYGLVGVQVVLTALTYLGFFELQRRSNPVFLSQMGCVAAIVGLLIGLTFFDEHYAPGAWMGVLIVLAGFWLTNTRVKNQLNSSRRFVALKEIK